MEDSESLASDTQSGSKALMGATKMGLYSINLGTRMGQTIHTCHLVILPLIPVCILLAQNASIYIRNNDSISSLQELTNQVSNAIDFAGLTRMLQEERVSVALNYFIEGRENITSLAELDQFIASDELEFLKKYKLATTFNNTDNALQSVKYWPKLSNINVEYLKTKLKFQIRHALFRTKIRDREKSIEEVLAWYNEVNTITLNYVTYSIHDSDISNFYRYIIGYKNLLRCVEYAGKAGILGMEYATIGLTKKKYENFLEFDALRREYLDQTTNFLPLIRDKFVVLNDGNNFNEAQDEVRNKVDQAKEIKIMVQYVFKFLKYTEKVRTMIQVIADQIRYFVNEDIERIRSENTWPLLYIVVLICFIPICVLFTVNINTAMTRYSSLYNEKVDTYNAEKRKTEKIIGSLLPSSIVREMKHGQVPKPELFDQTTIFFCDIVGFTNIASESTADQIIDFLNDLYSLFDDRIENYDVYKVETIGDAYMVASGVPVSNGNMHAAEIARMSLDLLAKIITFEVRYNPNVYLTIWT
jgi:hypothetical protein